MKPIRRYFAQKNTKETWQKNSACMSKWRTHPNENGLFFAKNATPMKPYRNLTSTHIIAIPMVHHSVLAVITQSPYAPQMKPSTRMNPVSYAQTHTHAHQHVRARRAAFAGAFGRDSRSYNQYYGMRAGIQ